MMNDDLSISYKTYNIINRKLKCFNSGGAKSPPEFSKLVINLF